MQPHNHSRHLGTKVCRSAWGWTTATAPRKTPS